MVIFDSDVSLPEGRRCNEQVKWVYKLTPKTGGPRSPRLVYPHSVY